MSGRSAIDGKRTGANIGHKHLFSDLTFNGVLLFSYFPDGQKERVFARIPRDAMVIAGKDRPPAQAQNPCQILNGIALLIRFIVRINPLLWIEEPHYGPPLSGNITSNGHMNHALATHFSEEIPMATSKLENGTVLTKAC